MVIWIDVFCCVWSTYLYLIILMPYVRVGMDMYDWMAPAGLGWAGHICDDGTEGLWKEGNG